ncbi:MAG: 3-methyl-2-oxobutanoate hydroxymethyltransferase [Gammaproteobacteria bacterium]|nr:MAG: 3-methyl-2-oxobutanoate hydroxymethyltransferase [Gammaproteobacteria bacterium]
MSSHPRQQPAVTVTRLHAMKEDGERIVMLTAYDASFARVLDAAGVDVVLVGDSLGMVVQGHDSTVPVTVDDMVYHARAVSRGLQRALLLVDMPFMSYAEPRAALANAARLMQEGGAQMVKLEGDALQVDTVRYLSERGIPVCAHLGLTPQYIHKLGGYRVQGRDEDAAAKMLADARALEAAGADLLLLECVPQGLAERITGAMGIPVIGIGAGAACDGQVLVLHDLLGVSPRLPRFARDFLAEGGSIEGAVKAYVDAVRAGAFPAEAESFS